MIGLVPSDILAALFDTVPGAYFFVKDHEARFLGGSDSFARIMGVNSVEDLVGKTDYDYSPDFLADAFNKDDMKVMSSGKPFFNKIELVPNAEGSLDWLCTSKVPLFDMKGKVIGLAGVARLIRDEDKVYAEHPEMRDIIAFVQANYRKKITVADMAACGGISVSSQERLFRSTFGLTPLMYLRRTRLNTACRILRESDTSIATIAKECGFNDQTNMTRAFRQELRITPLRYRKRFKEGNKVRGKKKAAQLYASVPTF